MEKYDIEYIKDYLSNSIVTPEARNELLGYVNEAFYRIINTLELIPDVSQKGKILEIGANPYFLTLLVKKYKNYDVCLTNYFGSDCTNLVQEIINKKYEEDHVFDFLNINIEEENIPYEKEYFDCILFCEIIEHLIIDPVFALQNLHRVLKKNSCLIFSTPNVYRYENVKKFAADRKHSIYDPYSGYGIYGRHNREYSLFEVEDLLKGCGFDLLEIKTVNSRYDFDYTTDENYLKKDNGEYILAVAKKSRQFSPYYPDHLFRSQKVKKPIDNYLKIGDNCLVNLKCGCYEIEDWQESGPIRWTSEEAVVLLKPKGYERSIKLGFYSMLDNFYYKLLVRQNGRLVLEKALKAKKGWQQELQRIKLLKADELEIVLKCQDTFSAKDMGINQDTRKIGLAIKEIFLI